MDTVVVNGLEAIGYYIAVVVICVAISQTVISIVLRSLTAIASPLYKELRTSSYARLAAIVGMVEQPMYIVAILIGKPEFIGVWLGMKVVGAWMPVDGEKHSMGMSERYMIFLIGNALSLIFAVGTALLMQQVLPPFPRLDHWRLPVFAF